MTCSIWWPGTWSIWRRHPSQAWRGQLGRLARLIQTYNPIGRAQRNVAHHYDLSGTALRSLPRPRPAVFLRLFHHRQRQSGDRPGEQEAPHRREAAARARPEGARHRLGWGGLGLYLARACRRRRHRRHALERAAQASPSERARRRRASPTGCASSCATIAPGPAATTASSRSACSSMSAPRTTASSSAR